MKYLGSKSRIANDILPIMLSGMKAGDTFVDAFCGGCNLLDKVPTEFHRIGNDKNKYLIAMWVRLTHYGWIPPTKISRELYNKYREYFNEKRFDNDTSISLYDAEVGWYGFMGSFNGRFFDGGYSGHDVNGRDYIGEQIRNTLAQVTKLKGVDWYYSDYDKIPLLEHSTIYCDIPYKDTKHDSAKPVTLFQLLIKNSTNKGDIVLDPFMGSGTTAIACINTERKYLGFEIDKGYWEVCDKRIKSTFRQGELFEW